MHDMEGGVVVGIFAAPRPALTVQEDLRRLGLTDRDVEVGVPASGRYRLDVREAESLGRGVLDGIVIGTIVGALLGVVLLFLAAPNAATESKGIILGLLMGAFWGSFFGGLGGMVAKSVAHEGGQWCEIPEHSPAVLVVAHAGAAANAARALMRRRGAETFLSQTPPIAEEVTTDGSGSAAESDTSSGHHAEGGDGEIAIPRGAYLLLILFLIALSALWANVYLRVVWRA
ncbi:MAG: hypothetical protein U0893_04985 [Chloroflexota bacterium]